jgi:hypothetical protein
MITNKYKWKNFVLKYGAGNTFYDRPTLGIKSSIEFGNIDLTTNWIKYLGSNYQYTQKIDFRVIDDFNIGIEIGKWAYGDIGGFAYLKKDYKYFDIKPELGYSKTKEETGVYFMSLNMNFKFDFKYSNEKINIGLMPNIRHKQKTSLLLEGEHGTRNFIRPNRLSELKYF